MRQSQRERVLVSKPIAALHEGLRVQKKSGRLSITTTTNSCKQSISLALLLGGLFLSLIDIIIIIVIIIIIIIILFLFFFPSSSFFLSPPSPLPFPRPWYFVQSAVNEEQIMCSEVAMLRGRLGPLCGRFDGQGSQWRALSSSFAYSCVW